MGVAAAFTGLYERYWQLLYNYAQRKGSSPEDAEDLVQGFFVDEGMHLLERLGRRSKKGAVFPTRQALPVVALALIPDILSPLARTLRRGAPANALRRGAPG
jgi:hypothetical protein